MEFLIRWNDFDESSNSWEPHRALKYVDMISFMTIYGNTKCDPLSLENTCAMYQARKNINSHQIPYRGCVRKTSSSTYIGWGRATVDLSANAGLWGMLFSYNLDKMSGTNWCSSLTVTFVYLDGNSNLICLKLLRDKRHEFFTLSERLLVYSRSVDTGCHKTVRAGPYFQRSIQSKISNGSE